MRRVSYARERVQVARPGRVVNMSQIMGVGVRTRDRGKGLECSQSARNGRYSRFLTPDDK